MSEPARETVGATARASGLPRLATYELEDAPKRRMLIIVNPHATTVSPRLRQLVVYALEGRFEVTAIDTEAPGHATELCREAAGYDVVVAFGGDGTVNEVANGLLDSSTPLTALPGGSANVFAKLLGIPADIVEATEHLLSLADDWRLHQIDLGVVNERCFTFASGLGLDASVVARVDANPAAKARFGPHYFAWVTLYTLVRDYLFHPPRLRALYDGRSSAGVTAVIQNGASFTYYHERPIALADPTALDSGSLTASVLERAAPLDLPFMVWRALSSRAGLGGHRHVNALGKLKELTVSSADKRPLPLQVDGDYVGEVSEAHYRIIPAALTVLS